jgi:hypothetical protein
LKGKTRTSKWKHAVLLQEAKEGLLGPAIRVAGFFSRFLPKKRPAAPAYANAFTEDSKEENEPAQGEPLEPRLLAEPETAELVEDNEKEYAGQEQKLPNPAKTSA